VENCHFAGVAPDFGGLIVFFLILLMFFSSPNCCKDNEWRGIRPLKTTRQEVENRLGKPTPDSVARNAARYETEDGKVFVLYSVGSCGSESNNGWNVPDLTVIDLSFYPKSKPIFSKLNFDRKNFVRRPDPEITYLVEYFNKKDGISITIADDEDLVQAFRYFPNEKDRWPNICQKTTH
jgi:hypothetical protein